MAKTTERLKVSRSTLANALYAAASSYEEGAAGLASTIGHGRLVEQLKRQADVSKKLAEEVMEADAIDLTD